MKYVKVLWRLIKGVWFVSCGMAVLALGITLLPRGMAFLHSVQIEPSSSTMEKAIDYTVIQFCPYWYLITLCIIAALLIIKGSKIMRGG